MSRTRPCSRHKAKRPLLLSNTDTRIPSQASDRSDYMFRVSIRRVANGGPVGFRNAIIRPLHVFSGFCRATSQTLIDPTPHSSMGTSVANCGGIFRCGGSIRQCSTAGRIAHKRCLQQHFVCVCVCVGEHLCFSLPVCASLLHRTVWRRSPGSRLTLWKQQQKANKGLHSSGYFTLSSH